jgi:DNA-binding transcriptional MerR regulator
LAKNHESRPKCESDGKPMLRMRELSEATGVKKPTILFYIREGLLQKPVKTSPNVAFYPVNFIERIVFIKKLQDQHRLSLTRIKEILFEKDAGKEASPFIEMHKELYGRQDSVRLDLQSFCEKTGLSDEQVKEAIKAKILIPMQNKFFDSEDLAMGGILSQAFEMGIRLKDISYYSKLGQKLADKEMEIHKRMTEDVSTEQAIAVTLDLTRLARALRGYVFDRLFRLAAGRRRFLD